MLPTEIGTVLFDIRKESNPCSLCAKMRKGALNEKAKELGCNKIAYAHHKEDVMETMMMSLFMKDAFTVSSQHLSGPDGSDCNTSYDFRIGSRCYRI